MLPTEETADRKLAYLFLRVFLGINIAVHGASRIYSGVAGFATELVSQFAKAPLAHQMVYSFGVSLPFGEGVIGVLIFLGLWSRLAYCARVHAYDRPYFRLTLRQDWTAAGMATAVRVRLRSIAGVSRAQPLLGGRRENKIAARRAGWGKVKAVPLLSNGKVLTNDPKGRRRRRSPSRPPHTVGFVSICPKKSPKMGVEFSLQTCKKTSGQNSGHFA
jgi:thiosulfate dehydrogenase [quinone] large subunit